jgi:hypothetical protein
VSSSGPSASSPGASASSFALRPGVAAGSSKGNDGGASGAIARGVEGGVTALGGTPLAQADNEQSVSTTQTLIDIFEHPSQALHERFRVRKGPDS